jgi:molybdopterin synthase catalytic subunit
VVNTVSLKYQHDHPACQLLFAAITVQLSSGNGGRAMWHHHDHGEGTTRRDTTLLQRNGNRRKEASERP